MTKDNEDRSTEITQVNNSAQQNSEYISSLKDRANQAEDHSRRNNLLFFDIKEEKYESPEDCEKKVSKF